MIKSNVHNLFPCSATSRHPARCHNFRRQYKPHGLPKLSDSLRHLRRRSPPAHPPTPPRAPSPIPRAPPIHARTRAPRCSRIHPARSRIYPTRSRIRLTKLKVLAPQGLFSLLQPGYRTHGWIHPAKSFAFSAAQVDGPDARAPSLDARADLAVPCAHFFVDAAKPCGVWTICTFHKGERDEQESIESAHA